MLGTIIMLDKLNHGVNQTDNEVLV